MRIGLFTDTYPPYINGVSTSVEMLKHALEKLGHDVYLVTVGDNALKYKFEEDNHVVKVPGIPTGIYDFRLSSIYPVKVINMIKSWNLDVIHSHQEFGIGIFARLCAKQFNIPLVHTYHTMYEDYTHYITKGHFDKSSKKVVQYITNLYCDKTATELIVPTEKTYRLFKDKYRYERNIHIIPTGIEVDRFYKENAHPKEVVKLRDQLKIGKKDFVIIYVGRLAQEKNVNYLLEAFQKVHKKISSAKLLIIGYGPDEALFQEKARTLKIAKNVIFTGKVPWDKIPNYYHLGNLFVTASTTETQGLTVIEAMAAGVVPLCIADEAFHNTVIDGLNGYIFHSQEECVAKIMKLYQDRKELERLSTQARIQAEQCSSKHYAERVLTVYERAIHQKKSKFGWISTIIDKIKRS